MSRPPVASMSMSRAKQGAERKRRGKAVPILGAAGLSLTLASGASATTEAPVADVLAHNGGVNHEITLSEEEISDVSLATFYVVGGSARGPLARYGVTKGEARPEPAVLIYPPFAPSTVVFAAELVWSLSRNARHRRRWTSDIRLRPAFVFGPVDFPPWNRQRARPGSALT